MIDRLTGVEPIKNVEKTQQAKQPAKVKQADSISISPESQRLSEAYLAKKLAMEAPDLREDKVAEMAKKLEDPNYMEKAISELAGKFVEGLGGF